MHTSSPDPRRPIPGRGANVNPPNRFVRLHVESDPDCPEDERPHPRTQFFFDGTESILSKNDSPDVPFTYGLNPYRGCEHGCIFFFNPRVVLSFAKVSRRVVSGDLVNGLVRDRNLDLVPLSSWSRNWPKRDALA